MKDKGGTQKLYQSKKLTHYGCISLHSFLYHATLSLANFSPMPLLMFCNQGLYCLKSKAGSSLIPKLFVHDLTMRLHKTPVIPLSLMLQARGRGNQGNQIESKQPFLFTMITHYSIFWQTSDDYSSNVQLACVNLFEIVACYCQVSLDDYQLKVDA